MRRWSIVTLLLCLALGPAAHAAAPPPQLRDAKGDWQVAGQDVLTGRVSSRLVGGKPILRGELTLAEAPHANIPATYTLSLGDDCQGWLFAYDWVGSARPGTSTIQYGRCDTPTGTPNTTSPAVVMINGTTIVWETPYVLGLKRGLKVTGFSASAATVPLGGSSSLPVVGYHEVFTCDIAFGSRTYVVGSDLPRR